MSPDAVALRFPSVDDLHGGDPGAAQEEARSAGYADGWAAGLEEGREAGLLTGHAEGLALAEARTAAAVVALQSASDELACRDSLVLADAADHLARLAMSVVEELLGRELATLDDAGHTALRRALSLAPDRGPVVARLHPDDADQVSGALDELAPGRSVEIVADPSVERAGAVVEVGPCRIDAQLGAALERVREVLAP